MKTWKPTTAGILNIITGASNVLGAIGLIIAILGMLPLGVTSTILVSLAKEEFEPQHVKA
jgi:hypothetical protein